MMHFNAKLCFATITFPQEHFTVPEGNPKPLLCKERGTAGGGGKIVTVQRRNGEVLNFRSE